MHHHHKSKVLLTNPKPTPIANPPKFLRLESETMMSPNPSSTRNHNLKGTIKWKTVTLGLRVAMKPMKEAMQGSAPTFGIGMMS